MLVLLVEDHPAVAFVSAEAIRDVLDCDVEVAGDGEVAMEIVGRCRPDLFLLDIGLPGMDGYELARRLRQQARFRETPIIAVTGYAQAEDRARARAAGFTAHYPKPMDFDELAKFVQAK